MKKLLIIITLCFLVISPAQADNTVPKLTSIAGKVIDALSKEPLPYVTIVIKDAQNKIITGGITGDNGNFIIKKIPRGKTLIEIQYIGYKTYKKTIVISTKTGAIKLGTIVLEESSALLDAVLIIAETSTITQKVDRKVINVGKDLQAAGTTAAELLNNVQSVSVDSQSGNISLRGNENVRILVDGKPTNIAASQLLQQIPSSSIKSVELITNPSAKYNPEGMSGIINIVLHKNATIGFNGNVKLGLTQGDNTRTNGSLNMNYKVNNVNFYMNYGANRGKRSSNGDVRRLDLGSRQQISMEKDNTSDLLKIGIDYDINDKNSLSFYTTQNWSTGYLHSTTNKVYDNENGTNTIEVMVNNDDSKSETYNFNYTTKFNKDGHELDFEFNKSTATPSGLQVYSEVYTSKNNLLNYQVFSLNKRENTIANIDYTNPISKTSTLEIGAEYRTQNTKNNRDSNQRKEIISDFEMKKFTYNRDIYSFYTNYNTKWDQFNLQVGARIEQYNVTANFSTDGIQEETYTDEIFSIYPSAFLTYNPSKKHQFQASYSRRVDRPGLGQVNPNLKWSTSTMDSRGNPNLKPQFTNSFELNYTKSLKNGSITVGTFYRLINNNISRSISAHPTNSEKVELSYRNTDDTDAYGIEVSTNLRLAKWWRINGSFDFYQNNENGLIDNKLVAVSSVQWNARISHSFTATKKLRFNIFSMYRGPGQSIQFKTEPMWMVNAGATYRVLKGKGTLSLRFNDIFKGMKFQFETEKPYPQTGVFNWESQTAYLGFNYRFGGGKNKAKQRKRRENNEKQGGGGFI
ncbi:MAG: TonB-dependent receptor [Flavobacteriaceae bacterium]|nr:TonB-dependent receptor [Flavobacteriaceae bacterium]